MSKLFPAVFFFLLLHALPASAQSFLSEGTAKFWGNWFAVPAKYLVSWQSVIAYAVAPVVITIFFAYEIWKELGFFHSGAANFWIPVLTVYLMLHNGFWPYVDMFVTNAQLIPAVVLSFLSFQITAKLRSKATSFGYTGIFGGALAYAFDAAGMAVFLGGIGFVINKGHFGPVVYIMAAVGSGLGLFLIWWDMRSKKGGSKLKSTIGEELNIEKEIARLEKERKRLNDEAMKLQSDEARLPYYRAMARVQEDIDILRAKRGVVESELEQAA